MISTVFFNMAKFGQYSHTQTMQAKDCHHFQTKNQHIKDVVIDYVVSANMPGKE